MLRLVLKYIIHGYSTIKIDYTTTMLCYLLFVSFDMQILVESFEIKNLIAKLKKEMIFI